MFKCCFRRRKRNVSDPYGEPILLSKKDSPEESCPSHETADLTPKRDTVHHMETTREYPSSLLTADPSGFASLHFTRLSCEEGQFSWQVHTAIELESLDPLILTAIENEGSVKDEEMEGEKTEMVTAVEWMDSVEKEGGEEEEEMFMMTALETLEKDEAVSDHMEGEMDEHPLSAETESGDRDRSMMLPRLDQLVLDRTFSFIM